MGKSLKGKELGKGVRQKPNGVYEARTQINGISISESGTDLNEVLEKFNTAKEKAKKNINTKLIDITLNEWYEKWFNTFKIPNISETSIVPMKNRYKAIFSEGSGKKKISKVLSIDLQNDVNKSKDSGRSIKGIQDAIGQLNKCFESAKHNKLTDNNPCCDLIVANDKNGNKPIKRRFLSIEEQHKFLMAVENNWYKEMFYIMLLTGMRIGEIGGLKWRDIDFKSKCIHVNQSLSCQYHQGEKRIKLTGLKTQNSYRQIPFMGEAEEMLLSQKKKYEALKRKLGNRWRGKDEFSDLIFVSTMGSPVIRYIAEKEINNIIKEINLKEAFEATKQNRTPEIFLNTYPHAMRHTFCSNCFRRGMNPKTVQNLMGHRYYSTTIDIYTHVMGQDYFEEAEKYGNIISDMSLVPTLKNEVPTDNVIILNEYLNSNSIIEY